MEAKVVDGFCWKVLPNNKEILEAFLYREELYALYEDGSESLIHTKEEMNALFAKGVPFGLEVGRLYKDTLLTISKEKILHYAKEEPLSKKPLKDLFPEAFAEEERVFCTIGSVFKRATYPHNDYAVFKWNGEVRVLNITHNAFWKKGRNIRVGGLKDPDGKTLTVEEFRKLAGREDLSDFIFKKDE